jgi:uncharacterized membrane protein YphA (DoxX/SURF4 family)/peroxiredoxin
MVGTLLLFARFVLCGVFVVAGTAKLADRSGSREALAGFGLPAALTAPLGVLVPIAELAVAGLLVPVATARWGAVGALALLAVFTAGVANAMLHGREPDCHCFGQLHSEPVGASTVARNAILAIVAGAVVFAHPLHGPNGVELASMAGAIVLAAGGSLAWHLVRQYGRVLLRLDALERQIAAQGAPLVVSHHVLEVGVSAPALDAADLNGDVVTLDDLLAPEVPLMLIFTDPKCGPCSALLPAIGGWQRDHGDQLTVALLTRGSPGDNASAAAEHGIDRMLLQRGDEPAYVEAGSVTPSGLLISRDGVIAAPVARGPGAIRELVDDVLASERVMHSIGDPAPPLDLSDITGAPVTLPIVPGRDTLVLSWDPACGHCERILDDVRRLEVAASADAPSLLVVSSGDVATNRALGLAASIALDPGHVTRRAFGMQGTPMGVVVDSDGRFASSVAAGAPAVLELLATPGSIHGR